MYLRHF